MNDIRNKIRKDMELIEFTETEHIVEIEESTVVAGMAFYNVKAYGHYVGDIKINGIKEYRTDERPSKWIMTFKTPLDRENKPYHEHKGDLTDQIEEEFIQKVRKYVQAYSRQEIESIVEQCGGRVKREHMKEQQECLMDSLVENIMNDILPDHSNRA